ncbi:hypothetical protein H1C71_040620, partial [Ictidomys tridecemlineatus]
MFLGNNDGVGEGREGEFGKGEEEGTDMATLPTADSADQGLRFPQLCLEEQPPGTVLREDENPGQWKFRVKDGQSPEGRGCRAHRIRSPARAGQGRLVALPSSRRNEVCVCVCVCVL